MRPELESALKATADVSKSLSEAETDKLLSELVDQIDEKAPFPARYLDDMQSKRFAVNLCRLMIQANMNAEAFSRFLGFYSNTVWRWTNLECQVTAKSLRIAARSLGVRPGRLIDQIWTFAQAEAIYSKVVESRKAVL